MTCRPMCLMCHNWMQTLLDGKAGIIPHAVAEHLKDCSECRQRLAAAEWLLSAVARWPEPEPARSASQITQRVLADRRERHTEQMRSLLAASLAISLFALFLLASIPESSTPPVTGQMVAARASTPSSTQSEMVLAQAKDSVGDSVRSSEPLSSLQKWSAAEIGNSASENGTAYSVQAVAYWFLPDPVRQGVEDVLDAVSPILTISPHSEGSTTLADFVPATKPTIERMWDSVWAVGENGWRLFRNLLPPLADQPNS